jgi:hypothetical protein
MSHRFLRMALAALLVIVAHQSASAQFTVLSQNTLHLGWGKVPYQTNKNAYLYNNIIGAATYDVVILQEVMQQANLAALTTQFLPGSYNVVQTAPLGPGSYKETYGFLVRVPTLGNTCCNITPTPTGQNSHTYTGGGFSRPPSGVLVQAPNNTTTWVINYHAMFGQVGARRTEVSRVAAVITQFQALNMGNPAQLYPRYVVGGDWNFPANDQAFTNIRNNFPLGNIMVQPTGLTSIKRGGVGLSSSYDHFLWDATLITCINPAVMPDNGSLPIFRQTFSDHLGVRINVQ